jgi:aminoglycoside phosphotransferase family enzyme/predicted kinase
MGRLKDDLEASGLALIETHISWVFLNRSEVFKIKRPVDFGFLDFSTVEARRRACEAEVDLNRRLAPDVYLGVLPVTQDGRGVHSIDGQGRTVDWAVHMRRLDERDRADRRLGRGALTAHDVDALAFRIAEFHESARCDEETTRHGAPDVIRRNVEENFEQTRASIGEYLTAEEACEIEVWQLQVLADEARFKARQRGGRVRDGHGDLRLEHVYFDGDSISIIDCIEFNERFRYGDVCADIAFLSMDLAWHGRVDLAEHLLATYAKQTCDYGLYSVVNFYESYRAFVRGKIASFLAADVEASTESRERAREEARRYFMLSLAFERPPLVPPQVVAVGGLIASGKSRTASVIGGLLAAPVVGSDRLRKHLMGRRADESMQSDAWRGPYSADMTAKVYETLWKTAETIVTSGRPIVVDASFRTAAMRHSAKALAERLGVPFTFVECIAPKELLLERLAARESLAGHESDARPGLLEEFEKRFEPVEELSSVVHLRIDTSRPPEDNLERLRDRFEV